MAAALPPSRTPRRPAGFVALLGLGMSLARRGALAIASIAICVFTSLALALVAVVLATRDAQSTTHDLPLLASSALAWGSGFVLAFSVATHALRRDRTDGVRQLITLRTTSLRGYVAARVGGLAAVVALLVGGGTIFCGLVTMAVSPRMSAVPRMLQATGAGVVYAIAFAAVVAPIAFAALGSRSRLGGYTFLLFVVAGPELLLSMMGSALPESVADVVSIPSALVALRTALAPGTVDPWRAVRAVIALSLVSALAMSYVRRAAILVDRAEVDA